MAGRLAGKVCLVTGTGGQHGPRDRAHLCPRGRVRSSAATSRSSRRRRPSRWSRRPAARWCRSSRASSATRPIAAELVELARERVRPDRRALQPRRQVALRPGRGRHRRGLGRRAPGRGRPDLLPHPCGLASADRQPRRGREHGLAERAAQLQEPRLAVAHDEQGGDHRDDAPARDGGERARDSCQLDLAGPDPERGEPSPSRRRAQAGSHAR